MTDRKINPEIDTTRFVNIYDEKFVFYINKQPREVESKEEKIMPLFVAQLGAKHLVDLILQKKYGIADSNRDSALRKSLFAQILPDIAEEVKVTPLSEEEFRKQINESLEKQKDVIATLHGKAEQKDSEVEFLKKRIEELENKSPKEQPIKKGRPRKQ